MQTCLRGGCSFLDPRGLGALEGYTLQEAAQQLGAGDSQSPSWRPLRNYDGASFLLTVNSDAGVFQQSQFLAAVSILFSKELHPAAFHCQLRLCMAP